MKLEQLEKSFSDISLTVLETVQQELQQTRSALQAKKSDGKRLIKLRCVTASAQQLASKPKKDLEKALDALREAQSALAKAQVEERTAAEEVVQARRKVKPVPFTAVAELLKEAEKRMQTHKEVPAVTAVQARLDKILKDKAGAE